MLNRRRSGYQPASQSAYKRRQRASDERDHPKTRNNDSDIDTMWIHIATSGSARQAKHQNLAKSRFWVSTGPPSPQRAHPLVQLDRRTAPRRIHQYPITTSPSGSKMCEQRENTRAHGIREDKNSPAKRNRPGARVAEVRARAAKDIHDLARARDKLSRAVYTVAPSIRHPPVHLSLCAVPRC